MQQELQRTERSTTEHLRLSLVSRRFKATWRKTESIGKLLKKCVSYPISEQREVRSVSSEVLRLVSLTKIQSRDTRSQLKV